MNITKALERAFLFSEHFHIDHWNGTIHSILPNGLITYTDYTGTGKSLDLNDLKHIDVYGHERKFSYNKHWTP